MQALDALRKCGLISESEARARTHDIASLKIVGKYIDFEHPGDSSITYGLTNWNPLTGTWWQRVYSDFFTGNCTTWLGLVTILHEGYHSGQKYSLPDGENDPPESTAQRIADLIATSPCCAAIYAKMQVARQRMLEAASRQGVTRTRMDTPMWKSRAGRKICVILALAQALIVFDLWVISSLNECWRKEEWHHDQLQKAESRREKFQHELFVLVGDDDRVFTLELELTATGREASYHRRQAANFGRKRCFLTRLVSLEWISGR